MIDKGQLSSLLSKYKTNETTVLREYMQVWFLSRLYSMAGAQNLFFKGGTALRLIFGGARFSEDLDFTVKVSEKEFEKFIKVVFKTLEKEESVEFKERKTIAGKKYLMTVFPTITSYKVFVSLDFSFREKIIEPEKTIIKTEYPVLFTGYVYHLSKDEILAEKIRAILSRSQGRDIYDLWYLLNIGAKINEALVNKKLEYYKLKFSKKSLLDRINSFKKKDFISDLRPFVAINEREKLAEFFDYVTDYIEASI
jgi:predicted nucleotidyltransferase component of viral defense system